MQKCEEEEIDGLQLAQNDKQYRDRTIFKLKFNGVPIDFMSFVDVKNIVEKEGKQAVQRFIEEFTKKYPASTEHRHEMFNLLSERYPSE